MKDMDGHLTPSISWKCWQIWQICVVQYRRRQSPADSKLISASWNVHVHPHGNFPRPCRSCHVTARNMRHWMPVKEDTLGLRTWPKTDIGDHSFFFERKNVHQTTIKGPSDFGASDFHHTKFDSLMFSSLASTGRRFTSLTSHDCRYSHAHKRHSLFLCWLLTKSNVVWPTTCIVVL